MSRNYKYLLTVNGREDRTLQSVGDIISGQGYEKVVGFREPYEEGGDHYHFVVHTKGAMKQGPLMEALGNGVRIEKHDKAGTPLKYAAKNHKAGDQVYEVNYPDWAIDRARGATEEKAALRADMDIMTAPASELMKTYSVPMVSRIIKDRVVVQDVLDAESYMRIPECDLTIVDYDEPDDPFVMKYDFDNQRFIDMMGRKRIGIKCLWICGPTGTGKTYQMDKILKKYDGYRIRDIKNWTGYHGQQLIGLNEFNGKMMDPISFRESLDANRMNVKYSSTNVNPQDTFWIVTCNYLPNHAWDMCYSRDQVEACEPTLDAIMRCCMVIRVDGVYKHPDGDEFGGFVYGTKARKYLKAEGELPEVTRSKHQRETDEVSRCIKRMKEGDTSITTNDMGQYFETIDCGGNLKIHRVLDQAGNWCLVNKQ